MSGRIYELQRGRWAELGADAPRRPGAFAFVVRAFVLALVVATAISAIALSLLLLPAALILARWRRRAR